MQSMFAASVALCGRETRPEERRMATRKSLRGTKSPRTRAKSADARTDREPGSTSATPSTVIQPLPPGTRAPSFTLPSTPGHAVSLSEFRGRPVVLAFYPADWSPVCGDQLALYNEVLPEFQQFGAELIGISVDGPWCHAAFAENRHLRFPLLADFEPKGSVAREYGVYAATQGVANRALFVIDRSGTIRWSFLSPMGVNPGADGILAALESMEGRGARGETAGQADRASVSGRASEGRRESSALSQSEQVTSQSKSRQAPAGRARHGSTGTAPTATPEEGTAR
jgi:peroxiredoxin